MRIAFAGFDHADFQTVVPVVRMLPGFGAKVVLLNKFANWPSLSDFPDIIALSPPAAEAGVENESALQSRLGQVLNMQAVDECVGREAFMNLLLQRSSRLDMLQRTSDYLAFVRQSFELHPADLVVLCPGEVESAIVASVCENEGIPHCYLLPQFYEFNWTESFVPTASAKFVVAGEYGRQRLLRRGVSAAQVVVAGSARFDDGYSSWSRQQEPVGGKTILYAMQGIPANQPLLSLLERFVSAHRDIRLLVRPHPSQRVSFGQRLRYYLSPSLKIDWNQHIRDSLRQSTVLVTINSLTILDALVCTVPVICWEQGLLPKSNPFAERGDVNLAHSYSELEQALLAVLAESSDQLPQIGSNQKRYEHYLGPLDGKRAIRTAELLLAMTAQGAAP